MSVRRGNRQMLIFLHVGRDVLRVHLLAFLLALTLVCVQNEGRFDASRHNGFARHVKMVIKYAAV